MCGLILSALPLAAAATAEAEPSREGVQARVTEALRYARQAEAAAAAQSQDRFLTDTDRALQIAMEAGADRPSHRLAEGIHSLTEAAAHGRQGRVADGREDLQTAIVWLTREAGYPVTNPSSDWTPGEPRRPEPARGELSGKKEGNTMDHFLTDIEEATVKNDNFRKVLFTAHNSQLVLMSLKPGEDIGAETHDLDQFIRVEAGRGTASLNGKDFPIHDGSALVIPAGTKHNIINSGKDEALKLYTIYSPPEHKDGVVHRTKQDAQADAEDHFDGKTTAMLQESGSR
jgi:mannose-6-phosphate isomerase-like protein (cupin superfamily)